MENSNSQTPENTQEQKPQNVVFQKAVPNSTPVLVLGIISIVMCWCYGLIGIILGIIALSISGKGKTAYEEHPELYTESSFKNLKAGRICAIIGLSLSGIYVIGVLIYLSIVGVALGSFFSSFPWESLQH